MSGKLSAIALSAISVVLLGGTGIPVLAASGTGKPKRYDGKWSVEVITEMGTCDRAYRYGIVIENSQARYAGGNDFTVSGGVQPNGAVRAVISRGSDSARVVGRLSEGYGNGTWTTAGSSPCGGRWDAERRG
ncbi:hypothetical protein [Methylobacterium soli]|uniref:hypothetical protein n=1 Tax=Methylobacterium soli TaxID=553447 RepID=UPI001FD2464E|nr:hypothetical protein [Methylobacterium soli]